MATPDSPERTRTENIAPWMHNVYADVAVGASKDWARGRAASSRRIESSVSTNKSASDLTRTENIAPWMHNVYADVAVGASKDWARGRAASSRRIESSVSTNKSASASEKKSGGRNLITL